MNTEIQPSTDYVFQQASVPGDTFTQLLGINDFAEVVGYHGQAVNQGVTLTLPNHFTSENFPGSAMTQVVGINNVGETDGFYVDQAGVTHGFTDTNGTFKTADAPGSAFTQLLGVNDLGVQAGYSSTDPAGMTHQIAFLRQADGVVNDLKLPTNVNSQAISVNDFGTTVGFYQPTSTTSNGFILEHGKVTTLSVPGSTFTQALGINNEGQVVGSYLDANGNSNGFVYGGGKFSTVDVPGATQTTINGINDFGIISGFSVSAATGNTNGFVAAKPFSLSGVDLKADLLPHSSGLDRSLAGAISHVAEALPGLFGSHFTIASTPALIMAHHG